FIFFFFFNDTATTEIYTLSLHDALPISSTETPRTAKFFGSRFAFTKLKSADRKSTRLNSSHSSISYAVFCLIKNNNMHDSSHLRLAREALQMSLTAPQRE